MYEIRFYYKNNDKNFKKDVACHAYSSYKTYEEATEEMRGLIKLYKELEIEEVVFSYSFPKEKIEPYVLFLNKKGKDLAIITETF